MKLHNLTDEQMNFVMEITYKHEDEFKRWADENESELMKWYDENESTGIFDCRFAYYCCEKFMEYKSVIN